MAYEAYKHLLFDRPHDGVLRIVINRPERLNAADETLHWELANVWRDVDADPETRVAIITGAGRAFCAGGDLEMIDRQVGDFDAVTTVMDEASDLVMNIVNCRKVVVSAINGVAVGAGLAVALMADISIVSDEARLTDGHVRLGVVAGDHATIVWPLLCGLAKAKYYLLTSDFIDGKEAERIGLVSKCVAAEELRDEALRVAAKLADAPELSVRWTKRALNHWIRTAEPIFDASLGREMLTFFGPDIRASITRMTEGRSGRDV